MPVTYEKIASATTVNNTTTNYTFSSIPSTYTDLLLVASVKATTNSGCYIRLNSDSGTNYSSIMMYGTGSSAITNRYTDQNVLYLNYMGQSYATSTYGTYLVDLNNYSNTSVFKSVLARSASPDLARELAAGLWRSTSAVNSLTVYSGAYFDTGCTFTLYGIKGA